MLAAKGGQIHITQNLGIFYSGDPLEADHTWQRLDRAATCARDYFSRNGIELALTTTRIAQATDTSVDSILTADSSVFETEAGRIQPPRFDDDDHGVTSDTFLSDEEYCGLFIHEVGRHLGLPPRYPLQICFDREIGNDPQSAMSNPIGAPSVTHLSSQDLVDLTFPLCRDAFAAALDSRQDL
jgi:hypothetical protein